MNQPRRTDDRGEIEPLIDVDEARQRPRRLDTLADQPDTGDLTDYPDAPLTDAEEDEADIVPGDKSAIYERGTIILPPG